MHTRTRAHIYINTYIYIYIYSHTYISTHIRAHNIHTYKQTCSGVGAEWCWLCMSAERSKVVLAVYVSSLFISLTNTYSRLHHESTTTSSRSHHPHFLCLFPNHDTPILSLSQCSCPPHVTLPDLTAVSLIRRFNQFFSPFPLFSESPQALEKKDTHVLCVTTRVVCDNTCCV